MHDEQHVPPETIPTLSWSDMLNKRVRDGDWPDQAIATTRKLNAAIAEQRWEPAAQLVDYFMEEAPPSGAGE